MLDWAQWKIETVDLCMQPYLPWRVELAYKASVTGFETRIGLCLQFVPFYLSLQSLEAPRSTLR